ncbi:unnamed protein product [Psylliodes chrysocephalus]|uniref:ABC-type xenobiotic transporter n=1 Tax=Psylliodes chrysocephalus TaxID=3402493 RepID=A0A9P0CC00_9CUCU|nr:unnamed protein product [Psylliodes chrysocephala]
MKMKNLLSRLRKYSFNSNRNVGNVADSVSYFGMFRYARLSDKLLLFTGIFCCILGGILKPIHYTLIGHLINEYVKFTAYSNSVNTSTTLEQKTEAEEAFLNYISFFCKTSALIGLLLVIFHYISVATFNYSSLRQIFRIRSEYLRAMLHQDISWYDSEKNDDFASRMSNDIYKLEDGLGEKIPLFLNMQVTFISGFILCFVKGWKLALTALVPIPLIFVVNGLIHWFTIKLAESEMQAYGTAGSIAEEVFTLIKTVTAFGGQQKEIDRYKKNVVVARKNNIRRSLFSGAGAGSVHLFTFGSQALVFWYGISLIIEEKDMPNPTYTITNVATILFCCLLGFFTIGQSAPYIETFGLAKSAATNIFRLIDNEPIINFPKPDLKTLISFKGNIEFRNVKFHYPSRPGISVLKGIYFKIKAGEKVAIVGGSGCGKSTIIQLLQRFYDPISGQILIDGNNIKELDLNWLRSNIGIVGQEPVLFSTSIIENIRYGKDGVTDDKVIAAAKKANAHDFIQSLPNGYNTIVGEKGTQLSGGQKQRIAIARALVRNPILLLLDEATSALDNTSEAKVQAALDMASASCTTIIVAHRLSTIRAANKIIMLSQGVVIEEGSHNELMALKNQYYGLVTAQLPSNETEKEYGKEINDYIDNKDKDTSLNNYSKQDMIEDDDFETNMDITILDVIKMNSPEWRFLIAASIASIFIGCGLPMFSVLFGKIIGQLANTDTQYLLSQVNTFCVYYIITGGILMISTLLQFYFLGIAGERMTERIRVRLFKAILGQEMSFFDKRSNGVGVLCAKLSADATSIQGATGQRIGTILQAFSTAAVAIGISLYYEWRLALVAASFTPFIIGFMFLNKLFNKAKNNDSLEDAIQNSTRIALEALSNIRTVAAFGIEHKFHQNYISKLKPFYKLALNSIHLRALVYGLSTGSLFFGYTAIIYYGGFLIVAGLSYDKVIQIGQCQMMGSVFIANVLAFAPNLAKGFTAAKKVKSFLSKEKQIKNVIASNNLTQVTGSINYSNIQFSYPTRPDVPVLNGLTLKISNGKTIALVGESGCGKSTILQLIEKFYDPSSGNIYLDDYNIKNISPQVLRSHLSIVSQEPNLFNYTISENIAYGDNSRDVPMDEIIQAAKNANIHDFISGLPQGYDTKLGERSTQLSGGQKQRIAIARALVRNPRILLLDEATSALDSESEKIVQEALDTAKKGRTCITIAHRLTTIQDADLICVVDKGVIVESGTHKELLNKAGFYYKMYSQNSSIN